MIADRLANKHLYVGLGERINKAFNFLANTDLKTLEPGKYKVEGDSIFAIVNEYQTKAAEACEIESHKRYLDIQYMVSGTELFGWLALKDQVPVKEYNEQDDFVLYNETFSYIKLNEGSFIIFYPTDIHQPEVQDEVPSLVKKVVMKVKLD